MRTAVTSALEFVESTNEWIGRVFCWLVVILNFVVVLEVVLRYVFNAPTVCNFEITKQLYAFHFMIVAGFTLLHGGHVSIDLVYSRFSERVRAFLDVIGCLIFCFPFTIIILFQGAKFAAASWSVMEKEWSVCGSPIFLIKTVIPISAFLLAMQALVIFVRKLRILIGKD